MDQNSKNTSEMGSKKSIGHYLKSHLREYGLLFALVFIMGSFQIMTDGILMKPLNITNLVLQNSYIIIMAVGMLLVIVAGHIDLSVGVGCRFHWWTGCGDDG